MCVMFHGDAAFYGQVSYNLFFIFYFIIKGIVAETLGLSRLEQFSIGI